jgi:hypothetical protein
MNYLQETQYMNYLQEYSALWYTFSGDGVLGSNPNHYLIRMYDKEIKYKCAAYVVAKFLFGKMFFE